MRKINIENLTYEQLPTSQELEQFYKSCYSGEITLHAEVPSSELIQMELARVDKASVRNSRLRRVATAAAMVAIVLGIFAYKTLPVQTMYALTSQDVQQVMETVDETQAVETEIPYGYETE